MNTWGEIVTLRTALIEQLEPLPAAAWDAPTLCEGWLVRHVVAHMTLPERMPVLPGLVGLVKAGFSLNRVIHQDALARGSAPIDEVIKAYRAAIPRRTLPPGRRPENVLVDLVVHSQDVRRPLGLPWEYQPMLLTLVLNTIVADRVLGAPKRVAGLRLRTTDLDWTWGGAGTRAEDPEISGPAEALLMAMANRPVALSDLDGPGTQLLASRLR